MNPLDTGEEFRIELMNPNPSSSKTKDGPKYRVSFEIERDAWDEFMDANTTGMVLEMTGRATVIPATKIEVDPKPKGGPISKAAAMLCEDENANKYAKYHGYQSFTDMIYARCSITSRAELDHDPEAELAYIKMKSDFLRWVL